MKSPARRHAVAYATSLEVCCKDNQLFLIPKQNPQKYYEH